MVNAKAAVLLIAPSVLVAAIAGIAFAAYANAQANPTPQGSSSPNGSTYQTPQQSYYPYWSAQNGYSYGYGYGCGRCGCGYRP
jgi:hypothetical protein